MKQHDDGPPCYGIRGRSGGGGIEGGGKFFYVGAITTESNYSAVIASHRLVHSQSTSQSDRTCGVFVGDLACAWDLVFLEHPGMYCISGATFGAPGG